MKRYLGILVILAWFCLPAGLARAATIDIMVLFDTKAKTWVDSNGGMQIFAAAAVAKMNTVLANSGLGAHNFNLVHFQAIPYTSTTLDNDLDALSAGSGGLSAVPSLRATYGADLVALLVDSGSDFGYVGLGYILNNSRGDPDAAYTVSAIRAVALGHTLTHEVGHNLGAHHSKIQADSPGPNYALNTYSAGWYYTGSGGNDYHTIMAYGDDGYGNSYIETPYFSTPNRNNDGVPVGHALDGDNARTIAQTFTLVAGYRSSVSNTCLAPASIAVPASDTDGTYAVSWGASPTPEVTYLLQEATNSIFTSGLRTVYNGSELSAPVSGRTGGNTYYYRVKATRSGYDDSAWRTAANGCNVILPAAEAPATLFVPSDDDDGSFTINWGPSATPDVNYTLEEATNSSFTRGLRTVYTGVSTSADLFGRLSQTYYYRVKADKNGYANSVWRTGDNGCSVVIVAAAPAVLTVPATDNDGSFIVVWSASSTPGVSYELIEATTPDFTGNTKTAYSGSATSVSLSGRTSATYYYRVAANANGYYTSSWVTAVNGCVVSLQIAGVPSAIVVPEADSDGSYSISWQAASLAGASYLLEEATNETFASGLRTVYTGTGLSAAVSGRGNGTYYYRVRTTKSGFDPSDWLVATNPCTVTLPLPVAAVPGAMTVPATDADGAYDVSWGRASLSGVSYTVEEATSGTFSEGLRTVYTGTGLSAVISGRSGGSYYYRVRSTKSGFDPSGWLFAANPCIVTRAVTYASAPASLTVPAVDDDGTYTIGWEPTSLFAAIYVLEEATDPGFTTGLSTIYSGFEASTSVTGRRGGTYYYRIKTTRFGLSDSDWLIAGNACGVLPTPPQLSLGRNGLTVTADWTSVPGASGYVLYAAPYPFTGIDSIVSIDMGSATGITVDLWPGAAFYVAIQSRNSHGNSGYSNIELFILDSR